MNKKKHRKIIEDEYDSQFDDDPDINQEERTNYMNNKLSKLKIHEKLQKLNFRDVMMDFMLRPYIFLLCGMQIQYILK